MVRFLIIVVIIAALFYVFKGFFSSDYKKCHKCEGKGYWIALRGEKNTCDACQGSGKVLR